jgi:hypothetical protein
MVGFSLAQRALLQIWRNPLLLALVGAPLHPSGEGDILADVAAAWLILMGVDIRLTFLKRLCGGYCCNGGLRRWLARMPQKLRGEEAKRIAGFSVHQVFGAAEGTGPTSQKLSNSDGFHRVVTHCQTGTADLLGKE